MQDHSVRLWDMTNGVCVAVLRGHSDSVNSLALRGDELLTAGDDGAVLAWRLPELLASLAPETPRKSGVFKSLKIKSPSVSK